MQKVQTHPIDSGTTINGEQFEAFDSYETEYGIINSGDYIAWKSGSVIHVGTIGCIYLQEGEEMFAVSMPLGKVNYGSNVVSIVGDSIRFDTGHASHWIEKFKNSRYNDYMTIERIPSGMINVEGQ